jgi:hypothetical protein
MKNRPSSLGPILAGLALASPALLGPAGQAAPAPAPERPSQATWIGQELRLPPAAPADAAALETAQAEPAEGETAPAFNPWSGTVELYGFAPLRSTGSVTIRGQEAEVDQDLGEILSVLRFAASARGSTKCNRSTHTA